MNFRKAVPLLAVLLSASLLGGCNNSSASQKEDTTVQIEVQEQVYTVQVQSITDHTITAVQGELTQSGPPALPEGEGIDGEAPPALPAEETTDGQTPPALPEGETANGEMPPELPSGESPAGEAAPSVKPDAEAADGTNQPATDNSQSSENIPAKPDGQASDEMPGTPPGGAGGAMSFSATGEAMSFTVDDKTEITLEMLQGTQEGMLENIGVNDVLEITLNDQNMAVSIIVKNLQASGGFGGSQEVTQGTSAHTLDSDTEIKGESYTSSGDDENALRIVDAKVTLDGITVEKLQGESSNTEDGDFYGQNAALLATDGAEVTIKNARVNTSVTNGNGIFSYGEETVINVSDTQITTSGSNSGGIQTTGGGTMNASNLSVETKGNSAAAIRSDRGGGTVKVTGGSYTTNGTGSPAIYSTADVSVSDAILKANASEALVIEGKNSIALENCEVTGSMDSSHLDETENVHNIMIYQSMSGDAAVGHSSFTAKGGSITAKEGDMIYITNTACTVELTDVKLKLATDILLNVSGNNSSRGWGTQGSNGGDCTFISTGQLMEGNIRVDDISSLDMTMQQGSELIGCINTENSKGTVKVTLDESSKWNLTADSYISELNGDLSQIETNGFSLYVNGQKAK